MNSKKLILLLSSIVVILILVFGFLVWNFMFPHKITTDSAVSGVTLKIDNILDINKFLNETGFWQRTTWDKSNQGAIEGKAVKSLKVIYTDKYLFATKGVPGEDLSLSSMVEIVNDEYILSIQTSKTGEQANQAIQKEFIRVMSYVPNYDEKAISEIQNKYKTLFFKLISE